jgi:hypothetical protein
MEMKRGALISVPLPLIIDGGRTYGDGLHKLEPGELGRIPVSSLVARIIGHVPVGVGGGLI